MMTDIELYDFARDCGIDEPAVFRMGPDIVLAQWTKFVPGLDGVLLEAKSGTKPFKTGDLCMVLVARAVTADEVIAKAGLTRKLRETTMVSTASSAAPVVHQAIVVHDKKSNGAM